MKWILAHWGQSKRQAFEAVEKALRAIGHSCEWIARNDMQVRDKLIASIKGGEFDVLLTWQRFFPMQQDLITALKESDIQTVYMDFGFHPHYESVVFDTKGENAVSSLQECFENASPTNAILDRENLDELLEIGHAPLAQIPNHESLERMCYPFVLVPLQRCGDSVVKYDSRVTDFGHLVRRILVLARGTFFVVCKTHPLDRNVDLGIPDYIAGNHIVLREPPGWRNDELGEFLLSRAALVVGVNSNMLFRALLYGAPVIATGRGWYSGSGAVNEVDGVDKLTSLQIPRLNFEARRVFVLSCLSRQLHLRELERPGHLLRVLKNAGVSGLESEPPV